MLVVDATRIGSLSATGQVKERLFAGWPSHRLMQVYRIGNDRLGLATSFRDRGAPRTAADITEAVDAYAPELLYVRPLPDPEHFCRLSFELLDRYSDVPVVTHMMDDWPAGLAETSPDRAVELNLRLRGLLKRSQANFSISDEMSKAYWQRYGTRFEPFANFLDPVDSVRWTARTADRVGPLLIRYSGGMAEDMSSSSLGMLADVIEGLNGSMHLDMSILPAWYERASERFSGYEHVSVGHADRTHDEYWEWLTEADVNVLAYNFDLLSQSYVGYSMANKLPDYLGVGRPILAIGPAQIPTLRVVRDAGAGIAVSSPEQVEIHRALVQLADDARLRTSLGTSGRQYALRHLSGPVVRTRFQRRLIEASGSDSSALSYLGGSSVRGLGGGRKSERGSMTKSARKSRPLQFDKKLSRISRVYSRRPKPTIRAMMKMVGAPFGGKLGTPALGAGAGFAAALALAVIGSDTQWVLAVLAISGGLSVLATTSAVARLRIERSLYGRRLEEAVRGALDGVAGSLHTDDTILHRELGAINERLRNAVDRSRQLVDQSRRLASESNELLRTRLADAEQTVAGLGEQIAETDSWVESAETALGDTTARVAKLETQIRDTNSNARKLGDEAQDLAGRIEALRLQAAEFDHVVSRQKGLEERLDDRAARRIQTELVERLDVVPAVNAEKYQPFSRRLNAQELRYLTDEWSVALGVAISDREVAYIAHRIGVLEEMSLGRLAASTARTLTRTIIARAAQAHAESRNDPVRILEIGTLFGVGLAALHEVTHDRGLGVELTAIDPLEGYYGPDVPDPITGVPVAKAVFEENMERLHIPSDRWRLVEDFSSSAIPALAQEGCSYHMIVIDGDHTYAGVKSDFEGSITVSAAGAYLVFDDYDSSDWPDVKRFVDEEVRPRSDLQFVGAALGTAVYRVIS